MAKPPRPYHHGNLRRTLLDTALATIARAGLGALSLREVARQAGVTHAAPYRHFRDRDALIVALGVEGFVGLGLEMSRSLDEAMDPLQRFRALGLAYVRYAVAHPGHFKVMFSPELLTARATPELQEAGEPTLQALIETVADAQAAGLFKRGDSRELSLPAWALVHGLAMLIVDGQLPALLAQPAAVDALANGCIDVAVAGLSSRAPSPNAPSSRAPSPRAPREKKRRR
jgi:AcrR family transcriptional regulator